MAAAIFVANLQFKNIQRPVQANITAASTKITQIKAINDQPIQSVTEQNSQLQSVIDQFVKDHSAHQWSIQIQGLGSDERAASYSPATVFQSASIYKLLLMYPLSQSVPINQWDSVNLDISGKNRSLTDCVTAMLKVSDNPCGEAVGNFVGWSFADSQLKLIGLTSTNLNSVNGPKTTVADVTYYLQGLYDGKWFDGATHDFIIKTLNQQVIRNGIPAGCGNTCNVADKTGALATVKDDAGIVNYPGGAYVLSIFSDGASYADIAELASQLQSVMAAS